MLSPDIQIAALGLITLVTSTVAGVFGFGGGMLFIAALPQFLPASAIIPVHSAVQWVSNISRAGLGWHSIHWQFVKQHFVGSLVGIGLAFAVFTHLNLTYIPLLIGLYILFNTWSKTFSRLLGSFDSFYILGAIQTGLSLLVGAPGPIPLPLLLKKLQDHHQIVCTKAIFMTTGHTLKLAIFIGTGFRFIDFWKEILVMAATAALGSLLGTRLRGRLNTSDYVWIVKLLLTLLATLAIYRSLVVLY